MSFLLAGGAAGAIGKAAMSYIKNDPSVQGFQANKDSGMGMANNLLHLADSQPAPAGAEQTAINGLLRRKLPVPMGDTPTDSGTE